MVFARVGAYLFGTEFAADKGVDVLNQLRIELIGFSLTLFGQPALPLGFFGAVLLPLDAVPLDFSADGAFVAVKLFGNFGDGAVAGQVLDMVSFVLGQLCVAHGNLSCRKGRMLPHTDLFLLWKVALQMRIRHSLKQETGRLKIAFWKQAWFGGGNDEGTEAAFAHSLKLMQDAGHELEEATPDFAPPEQLNRAARIIVMGETAKLFYQYQYETGQKLPHRLLEPTTWAMIVQGRQISAGEMAWARDVMLAQERAAKAFFMRYDALMTPVCPRTTPKIGEMMPPPAAQKAMRLLFGTLRLGFLLKNNPFLEKEAAAALQYVGYTSPLNMSGNPAMSVPLYRHNGLPVGTQFAAAHGREDTLLSLAAQLEQIQPWAEIPQVV